VFSCEIPVRFGDVDHAKIVYYPRYFHFCHVAMEEMFAKAIGVPYHEVIGKDRLGFPAVHIESDFGKIVGFGETLRMEVGVERIGKSSVVFRYAGYRSSDGAKAFTASITTVAVDMDRFESIPIPAKYRSALERLKSST
jgi:4-hydroxybenzoyl-CoA thioesterase